MIKGKLTAALLLIFVITAIVSIILFLLGYDVVLYCVLAVVLVGALGFVLHQSYIIIKECIEILFLK